MKAYRFLSVFLIGVGAGAGAAFLYDPHRGKARRARVRDQGKKLARDAFAAAVDVQTDIANRLRGSVLERLHAAEEEYVSDEVILERVRSKLGHVAHDPHKIQINVSDGHVVVSGKARPHEVNKLVHALRHVRGVVGVEERFGPRQIQGMNG